MILRHLSKLEHRYKEVDKRHQGWRFHRECPAGRAEPDMILVNFHLRTDGTAHTMAVKHADMGLNLQWKEDSIQDWGKIVHSVDEGKASHEPTGCFQEPWCR